jgi:hypothetical protein
MVDGGVELLDNRWTTAAALRGTTTSKTGDEAQ